MSVTDINIAIKNNDTIICYIGKNNNRIKSFELYNDILSKKIKNIIYESSGIGRINLGDDEIKFYQPLFEKDIKIIDSQGFEYKANIYFIEDIKNIIAFFKMKNPHYKDTNSDKYFQLTENEYSKFFLGYNKIIKDFVTSNFDFKKLREIYEEKSKKLGKNKKIGEDVFLLKEINDNIDYYSKVFGLKEEKIFYTRERAYFQEIIKTYYYETKNENIFGICGNYASGKSISIILFNHSFNFPTLYLNLKVIKNSFETDVFKIILPNEAINMFIKNGKEFNEYKNFLLTIYDNNKYKNFDEFLLTIINYFKDWEGLIFLDQFNHVLFSKENDFINNLKILLNSTKLKVLLINSMNDKWIRNFFVNNILEKFDGINRNKEFKFFFLKKLFNKDNMILQKTEEHLNPYFELFDFLPLYYSLIINNKKELNEFMTKTKNWIYKKIIKFFNENNNENNIIQLNEIRIKIDEEIDKKFFEKYQDLIPFKYFYIDNIEINGFYKNILKCHFPLIKEIWNEILYSKTIKLFDGEINYTGKVLGTFLELNFINQCKNNNFSLDIDCIVEIDRIYNPRKIIKKNVDDFLNKNILLVQKNENAPYFDLGYIRGKNLNNPQLSYIQIKKNSTNNKVDKNMTYSIFENDREKFFNLFGIKLYSCYLVYITLLNKTIKQNILNFKNMKLKDNKSNKLNKDIINMVKSINILNKFCIDNNIILYYFEPNEKMFYIRNEDNFYEKDLNLFDKNSIVLKNIKIKTNFLNKKKERELKNNELELEKSKSNFLFLQIVNNFIKINLEKGKIKTFIFLEKEDESTINYEILHNIIILCLIKDKNKTFSIKSIISGNYIIPYDDIENKQFIDSFEIDVKEYDLLVWVYFEKFTTKGEIYNTI